MICVSCLKVHSTDFTSICTVSRSFTSWSDFYVTAWVVDNAIMIDGRCSLLLQKKNSCIATEEEAKDGKKEANFQCFDPLFNPLNFSKPPPQNDVYFPPLKHTSCSITGETNYP